MKKQSGNDLVISFCRVGNMNSHNWFFSKLFIADEQAPETMGGQFHGFLEERQQIMRSVSLWEPVWLG